VRILGLIGPVELQVLLHVDQCLDALLLLLLLLLFRLATTP
jgi:hypothetical protein